MSSQPASPRDGVVVYGLSSEGYQIASKLAVKAFRVSIIDEALGTTMELRPEIAADYRELKSLLSDEILVHMKPQRETISRAKVVFFTPKIRRREEDVLAEIRTRLTEISKHLSPGTLLIFCLPLGLGGAREVLDRIEHSSGLVCGKDLFFAYSPLDFGKPYLFGCDDKLGDFASIIEGAGFSTEIFGLSKTELVHAQKIISRYSIFASQLETAKKLTLMGVESPREYKQVYSEDLNASSFDLKVVVNSLESGDPLLYLGSGSLKSIESYERFLVDRAREVVRIKDLKASRLRIVLFTDADSFEMRGDKLNIATDVVNRLKDFFSDIEYLNIMKDGFMLPMEMDKTNLFIFLSGSAEQKLLQLYDEQIALTKTHMIRANLPVEFVN